MSNIVNMKINLENFPFDYGKVVSNPSANEGGRSFILDNKSGHVIRRWAIDNVVFKNSTEIRCDYLIEVQKKKVTYFWVELKGKDLVKACKQILNTINFIHVASEVQQESRVITTGTNTIDIRSIEYQRLDKIMRKTGGCLKSHTTKAIEVI